MADPYPHWPNLASMMFDRARLWARRPMLRVWRDGAWQSITWAVFARRAAALARALREAGISPGDRVLIVAENRPEYPIAETALMAIRAVPVPTYTTNTVEDHAHILADSGARAAIVSSARHGAAVMAAGRLAGGLDLLVTMEPLGAADPATRTLFWDDLLTPDLPIRDIAAEAATIPPGAMACLIYTSGTGGAPKGVMTPHRAILSNCRGAATLIGALDLAHGVYLSFLPLSHSYEHTVGQFFLLSLGTEIVYARGVEHLAADLLQIRPTIVTAVPRVLEVIRNRVLLQVGRERRVRRALFAATLRIGTKRIDGLRLSVGERIAAPFLDRLVAAKVRARFGGRVVAAISGGARLDPEVGRFFLALGLPLLQGYGQTEAGPVISATPPGSRRIETVGPPFPGVDLRIAGDGEILVRGDLVMDGYWGSQAATAQVIRDGWLHTGDIGHLDADGFLVITDRKKDMIVLSGGENVSPAKVEGMLMAEPEIAQAVIAGDGRTALSALVVAAEGYGEEAVALAVARANLRLSVTERIRRHALVAPFTQENGLLTPTQKIRRLLVVRAHAATLAALHGKG
ncbi:MAG: AMP-binding protein [Rhodospirillales bacterium]|nr:AMP-binding protein [Rhodospirillales bacterium]